MIAGLYDTFQEKWKSQTVWVISDTHFGDEDLRAGIASRPSDEELVKMINAKVGRKDVLIHLGDVGNIEFAKQLRGYKVLIMGNHDAGKTNYEGVFDEIYEGALIAGEKLIFSHEPVNIPWAQNIHGHVHIGSSTGVNVCLDACGYQPLNLNQFMKGGCAKIETIHRDTIDKATIRKKKRGGKKIKDL